MLRLTGGIGRLEGESGITLLGLPPAVLPQLNGWRDNDAPASLEELAARLDGAGGAERLRLPPGLTRLRARVTERPRAPVRRARGQDAAASSAPRSAMRCRARRAAAGWPGSRSSRTRA